MDSPTPQWGIPYGDALNQVRDGAVGQTQFEPFAGAHAGQRSLREIAAKLAVKGCVSAKGLAFSPLPPKVIIDA